MTHMAGRPDICKIFASATPAATKASTPAACPRVRPEVWDSQIVTPNTPSQKWKYIYSIVSEFLGVLFMKVVYVFCPSKH